MTEKLLTSPLLPPSPTSQDLVDGVNRSKCNFFPEQHQHKPTKTFVPGQHARIQEFTHFPHYNYTFSRGGGPTFSRGGGVQMLISIQTHIVIFLGDWTPYPPLDPQMYNVAFWHK